MGQTSYFKQKRSVMGANVCVTQRYMQMQSDFPCLFTFYTLQLVIEGLKMVVYLRVITSILFKTVKHAKTYSLNRALL